ncbi:hypothetical protein SDC9_108023 [bioreactor metagenome]|uniref:Uncharacterized protein n=1 Tax=bioreactor metagenome TaxID=1076179 RepID=A0A645B6Y3_9ZZZZ
MSSEQAAELTEALNDCKEILTETVIDTAKCQAKIDRLVNILVDLGAISKEEPSEKEATLLKITKSIYEYISKKVGNKGFSDLF